MPFPPEDVATLRGQVMHDLGQWQLKHQSASPSMVQAMRFAAARAAAVGLSGQIVQLVALRALSDWRATQRVRQLAAERTVRSAFTQIGPESAQVGVRVLLHLEFPEGRPPGQRDVFPVVLNVTTEWTLDEIRQEAMRIFNSGEAGQNRRKHYQGVATGAEIIQVVYGGFSQAPFAAHQ